MHRAGGREGVGPGSAARHDHETGAERKPPLQRLGDRGIRIEPGDILVAPATDPSWTPLFVPAAAVVVDVGALLSHSIIVSRELGIPCVPSALDASRRIPDGSIVEVDGDRGVVTLVELPA